MPGPARSGQGRGAAGAKRGRLTRSGDFERVFRQGRARSSRHLVVYAFPRAADGDPRVGLSVSRRVGGAVERNHVKRLLREAFRAERARLPEGCDVVAVARRELGTLAKREGLEGVRGALADLLAGAEGEEAGAG
jgi:ribonuclease P protein component